MASSLLSILNLFFKSVFLKVYYIGCVSYLSSQVTMCYVLTSLFGGRFFFFFLIYRGVYNFFNLFIMSKHSKQCPIKHNRSYTENIIKNPNTLQSVLWSCTCHNLGFSLSFESEVLDKMIHVCSFPSAAAAAKSLQLCPTLCNP